jgi:hypothetical protein
MNWRCALIPFPLAFVLSACGDTWGERAVTGGGMGAGTGLAIGAVVAGLYWLQFLWALRLGLVLAP